jgi:hypothetical protein
MRRKNVSALVAAVAVAGICGTDASAVTPVTPIAVVGQTINGSGSLTVTDLNTAFVSGNDKVGFLGTLSDTSRFVFFDNAIAFKSSDVVSPVLTGGEGTIGVGNLGEFAYSPSADGSDAIWSHIGLLHKSGEPAPGIPGMFNTFGSRPRMSANGTAFWMAGLTNTQGSAVTQQDVLWQATTTGGTPSYQPLLRGGDVIGTDTIAQTGLQIGFEVSDNGVNSIVEVDFDGATATDAAVLLNRQIVAREGSPTSPGGPAWVSFRHYDVNNAGNFVVVGDTNAPTTNDETVTYNNTILAQQGQSLAGVTLGTTADAAAINDLNQVIHIWDLTSGTDEGLFFTDPANVAASLLLLRTGDELDTSGDGTADFTLTDFNASAGITQPLDFGDNGRVYVDVDLTPLGGTDAVQAIISVVVPEPGALSLLAVAGIGLLRRRK